MGYNYSYIRWCSHWAEVSYFCSLFLKLVFSPILPIFIAVLFGIGDNCVNTSRSVICSTVLQDKQPQVFAISKFHQVNSNIIISIIWAFFQTLVQAILMFLSPKLPVYAYFIAMLIYGVATGFQKSNKQNKTWFQLSYMNESLLM